MIKSVKANDYNYGFLLTEIILVNHLLNVLQHIVYFIMKIHNTDLNKTAQFEVNGLTIERGTLDKLCPNIFGNKVFIQIN